VSAYAARACAHQQSLAIAHSDAEADDQAFVDAISYGLEADPEHDQSV
jgi:hypothetical protein